MVKEFPIIFILTFFFNFVVLSQQWPEDEYTGQIIEEIAAESDENTDYSDLVDNLVYYSENPLNINTCKYEDLARLMFLTDFQIRSLLEYVRKKGPVLSIHEIQYVYGFNNQEVRYLEPFITLGKPDGQQIKRKKHILKNGKHEIVFLGSRVLELSEGYKQNKSSSPESDDNQQGFPGDPYKTRIKYSFRSGNSLNAGIQAEKDAGEEIFKGSNPAGYDFYSGYVQLQNFGIVHTLLAGDYQLHFGQGLALSSGTGMGKNAFNTSVSKWQDDIKKHSSSDENKFFRGAAAAFDFRNFTFSAFASSKKIDANIIDTPENGRLLFSSFQTSGYHRTSSEIMDEKQIREVMAGSNISLKGENFKIGATFVHYSFGGAYLPAGKPYNLFAFSGSSLTNMGIDYSIRCQRLLLFGETARGNKAWAHLHGIEFSASSLASFSLLYRNYSRSYFVYRANPFSEYSSKNNEQGLYFGTTLYPAKYLKLLAYVDVFRTQWVKFNVNSPSSGKDYSIQLDYTPAGKLSYNLRYKFESKSKNSPDETTGVSHISSFSTGKLRFSVNYKITVCLESRTRIEGVSYDEENTERKYGWLFCQDIIVHPQSLPLSIYLRFCRFRSESYDTRIYVYENSVPYSFSVPACYNNGIRNYLMIKYEPLHALSLWMKYSFTHYYNLETIGTGLNTIDGNVKSEAEMMVRIKF